jgi:hypothetical protein
VAQGALVGVRVAPAGRARRHEALAIRAPAAEDLAARDFARALGVGIADPAELPGAAAVGLPGDELVLALGAAEQGDRAGELVAVEVAEVALEVVGGADRAGGREVVALAAVTRDGVLVAAK